MKTIPEVCANCVFYTMDFIIDNEPSYSCKNEYSEFYECEMAPQDSCDFFVPYQSKRSE